MVEFVPMQASPRRVDFTEGYPVRLRAALNRGEGRLMTLSQGGAYVATPVTLLPQAQLSVAIDIPELSRTVEVEAVVAWENRGPKRPSTSQPDGYGIRFIRVPYASAEAIYWLLRKEEGHMSHDPEKTRALTPWEIQEAMERAQRQFGRAATTVPEPVNPFEVGEGPPYRLSSSVLFTRVPRAPGVFVLSYDRTVDARVERADEDLRQALTERVGDYPYFHFEVIPMSRARFERECELYHRLGGDRGHLDNSEHPLPPSATDGIQLKCPVCVKGNQPR
jgi:PilZ domain